MRVAVTGATGFIGRNLVRRHLERGDSVRVLSRRPYMQTGTQGFVGDLVADTGQLLSFVDGVDVLYHCAGEVKNHVLMYPLHVQGTQNLIGAAEHRVGRWIQLSSVGAYGPARDATFDETAPAKPEGEYERTKTESDALVEAASTYGAFPAVTLRPSIVFGPDMPNQSVFRLIEMVSRRKFFFMGRPGAIANYVYIDDVIDALELCGRSDDAKGIYNLSDDVPIEAFVEAISREIGISPPSIRVPEFLARAGAGFFGWLPGFPLTSSRVDALTRRTRYLSCRIKKELGYSFRTGTLEGISVLARYWAAKQ